MISTFQGGRKFRVAVVGGDGRGANLDWPVGYDVRLFAGARFGGNGEKRRLRDALAAQNIDGIIWLARWNGHDQRFLRDAQVPHRVWEKGMSELAKELPDIFPTPPWTKPKEKSEIDWTQAPQAQEIDVATQEAAGGSVAEQTLPSSKDIDDALSLAAETAKGDAVAFLRSARDLGVNVPVGEVIARTVQLPPVAGIDLDLLGRQLHKYLPRLGAEWVSPRMARRLSGCSVKGIADLVASGSIRRDVDHRGNRYHKDDCVKAKKREVVESALVPDVAEVVAVKKTLVGDVLEVLRARPGKVVRVPAIVKFSGWPMSSVTSTLSVLRRKGEVELVKKGHYRLVVASVESTGSDDQWIAPSKAAKILGLSKDRVCRLGFQHNNSKGNSKRLYFLPDVLKFAEQRNKKASDKTVVASTPLDNKEVARTHRKALLDVKEEAFKEVVEAEVRALDLGVHDVETAVKVVLAFVQRRGVQAYSALWDALVLGVRG